MSLLAPRTILPNVPDAIDKDKLDTLREFLEVFTDHIRREFAKRTPNANPSDKVLISSPRGNVYSITVADDGTLSTTAVYTPP